MFWGGSIVLWAPVWLGGAARAGVQMTSEVVDVGAKLTARLRLAARRPPVSAIQSHIDPAPLFEVTGLSLGHEMRPQHSSVRSQECASPRLWLVLAGHYRTFLWTQHDMAEVARRSSNECFFAVAAVPDELCVLNASQPSLCAAKPGDEPLKWDLVSRSHSGAVPGLLNAASRGAFRGRLAYVVLRRRGKLDEYPQGQWFLWRAAWELLKLAVEHSPLAGSLQPQPASVVIRTRPDVLYTSAFDLERLSDYFDRGPRGRHLILGQNTWPSTASSRRSLLLRTQGDVHMVTSFGCYLSDVGEHPNGLAFLTNAWAIGWSQGPAYSQFVGMDLGASRLRALMAKDEQPALDGATAGRAAQGYAQSGGLLCACRPLDAGSPNATRALAPGVWVPAIEPGAAAATMAASAPRQHRLVSRLAAATDPRLGNPLGAHLLVSGSCGASIPDGLGPSLGPSGSRYAARTLVHSCLATVVESPLVVTNDMPHDWRQIGQIDTPKGTRPARSYLLRAAPSTTTRSATTDHTHNDPPDASTSRHHRTSLAARSTHASTDAPWRAKLRGQPRLDLAASLHVYCPELPDGGSHSSYMPIAMPWWSVRRPHFYRAVAESNLSASTHSGMPANHSVWPMKC